MPGPDARVLDHGCGEAIHAGLVAARAAKLLLCEAAPSVRAKLQRRFGDNSAIEVLAPEELERLPASSLDLVIANSLVQYLSPAELDRLLVTWRRLLAPGGILIVADVISARRRDVDGYHRAAALCRPRRLPARGHRWTHSHRLIALSAAACEARHFQLQRSGFLAKLRHGGFAAERLPFNLEHNPARMTFRARVPDVA